MQPLQCPIAYAHEAVNGDIAEKKGLFLHSQLAQNGS